MAWFEQATFLGSTNSVHFQEYVQFFHLDELNSFISVDENMVGGFIPQQEFN